MNTRTNTIPLPPQVRDTAPSSLLLSSANNRLLTPPPPYSHRQYYTWNDTVHVAGQVYKRTSLGPRYARNVYPLHSVLWQLQRETLPEPLNTQKPGPVLSVPDPNPPTKTPLKPRRRRRRRATGESAGIYFSYEFGAQFGLTHVQTARPVGLLECLRRRRQAVLLLRALRPKARCKPLDWAYTPADYVSDCSYAFCRERAEVQHKAIQRELASQRFIRHWKRLRRIVCGRKPFRLHGTCDYVTTPVHDRSYNRSELARRSPWRRFVRALQAMSRGEELHAEGWRLLGMHFNQSGFTYEQCRKANFRIDWNARSQDRLNRIVWGKKPFRPG